MTEVEDFVSHGVEELKVEAPEEAPCMPIAEYLTATESETVKSAAVSVLDNITTEPFLVDSATLLRPRPFDGAAPPLDSSLSPSLGPGGVPDMDPALLTAAGKTPSQQREPIVAPALAMPGEGHMSPRLPAVKLPDGLTIGIVNTTTMNEANGKPYTVYVVEIDIGTNKFRLVQRYSEFFAFHQTLRKKFEKQQRSDMPPLPELPPKDYLNKDDPNFIMMRRQGLERYLQELTAHPYISRGKDVKKIAQTLLSILPGSLQGHYCYQLLDELKQTIQSILGETSARVDAVVAESSKSALKLCYVLEKILTHGLKGGSAFFNKKYFWVFFLKLKNCLPEQSIGPVISLAEDCGKNKLAKGRVFLRIALNDQSLCDYLRMLLWNAQVMAEVYEEHALVRQEEHCSVLLLLLEMLDTTQFTLWIKDRNLADVNYYDRILLDRPTRPTSPQPVVVVPATRNPSVPKLMASPVRSTPPRSRTNLRTVSTESLHESTEGAPQVGEQLTASLWSIVCISLVKEEKVEGAYEPLLQEPCCFASQIESDIHRVLTKVSFETGDGPKLLSNVLNAFSLHHPEIGYSQDLAFISAMLLLQLEEEGAFWVLGWVAKKYSYRGCSLFSSEPAMLNFTLFCMDRIVKAEMPELHAHLQHQGVLLSMFASEWFSTLFSYQFPIPLVFRIWDVLFLEDKEYLFKVALAILMLVKEQLFNMTTMEETVSFFKKGVVKHLKDGERLLKVAEDLRIPGDIYKKFDSAFEPTPDS